MPLPVGGFHEVSVVMKLKVFVRSAASMGLTALFLLAPSSVALADTTIGTNIVTTGYASVSLNFEVAGYASVSGNLNFGGTGTHTIGVGTDSGALTINAFTLGGAVTGNSQNITGLNILSAVGASTSLNIEAGGYASISGNLKFGGSGTHTIGVETGSGALTINAFTLGGAITGGSQNVTGLGLLTATNASVSNRFETPTASISQAFFRTDIVVGASTASSSTKYVAEFTAGTTATTSVLFGGNSTTKGTCLQLKNTEGGWVYLRIVGTVVTVNAVGCHTAL